MAPAHDAIDRRSVHPVPDRFFAGPEREISPHQRPGWQQTTKNDVRAQMHVMMAIETGRRDVVEASEFLELRLDHIFERAGEPRMKHRRRKPMGSQIRREPLLVFHEPRRRAVRRERTREVEV